MFLYFLTTTFGFTIFTWFILEMIRQVDNPPSEDDEGGLGIANDFPIIDLPPGGSIDDLLVDRWHGAEVKLHQFNCLEKEIQ